VSCDVAIVGAGVVGCAAAACLARAGARVEVLERGEVAGGASGRNSGAIEHPFDAEQAGIHERTLAMLRELDEVGVADEPAGMLLLALDERTARAAAERHAGFEALVAGVLDPGALRALEPGLADGVWAALLRTGYPVAPAAAALALRDRAVAAGARFRTGAQAGVEVVAGRAVGVRVGAELVRSEHVLVCAGAASADVLAPAGIALPVSASWGVVAEVRMERPPATPMTDAAIPEIQAGGRAPERVAFSLIAGLGGTALGSTFLSAEPDPAAWLDRLVAGGARFVPALAEARVAGLRACARPQSADGRPFLGPLPAVGGLHVAAGHGGRGISTGAGSAALVAEAILAGDASAIPPALRADRVP
jgi:glycine/D-amino acid oxidase-like deaminating enzyme